MLTDSKTGNQPRCQDNSKPLISKVLLRTCTTRLSAASGEVALQIRVVLSDLCDVLQHSHVSHLLLDGSVVVNLVPKLGSVGCMVHLTKSGKAQAAIRPQFIILSQEFDSSHKIWGNKLLQVVFFWCPEMLLLSSRFFLYEKRKFGRAAGHHKKKHDQYCGEVQNWWQCVKIPWDVKTNNKAEKNHAFFNKKFTR